MSAIKRLGISKVKALGLKDTAFAGNSYRNFLEKKAKYPAIAGNFPDIDFEKISYQEISTIINIKYK
ncbi:hypothetical protein LZQ00_12325 [Sphingobacterium sp. SRCM116780]|uniref:hypothetical protein n=1 Tax=Sphingobacterium sp. SRCM116780 TaxID=2907623 RepID=UPI001F297AC7|nr:hypothetical protein [Sphingobacterium sp. SRCM116780]UIR55065.1 hypothetical protein LZQ00_12325 [Sphingobacterium sp. SRCM116780]